MPDRYPAAQAADDNALSFDERAPLLQFPGSGYRQAQYAPTPPPPTHNAINGELGDLYQQFCHLVGVQPTTQPPGQAHRSQPDTLWYRATRHRRSQNRIYLFTATLTNTLLMSQVVLGAALTGLGASDSSRVLITVFGALNTVIAGLIAYLKSRGQPMRSRMFRDDLERVVDEIENSATMWYGISRGAHGYDAIDIDDRVTVRSEVARLTRLYDRAVKANTLNDPDMYAAGGTGDPHSAALRANTASAGLGAAPAAAASAPTDAGAPPAATGATDAPAAADPDESPATTADHPAKSDSPKDPTPDTAKDSAKDKSTPDVKDTTPGKDDGAGLAPKADTPSNAAEQPPASSSGAAAATKPASPAVVDDDESPATSAHPPEANRYSSGREDQKIVNGTDG